jgi:thiopeptide-type bacteriocin biosynthesis protein
MQRDFCLGSEWLYYKIYTGVKTSDYILLEKLKPIISNLKRKKVIQKWFFIRYKDTDVHLRIRFLLSDAKHATKVIKSFYSVFNELLEQNLAWNIQTDTYKREIERYGENTMLDSEFLFWEDSKMILHYIKLKSQFVKQDTQLLFSFYAIDSFLNSFRLSDMEKLSLMDNLQTSFKIEFDAGKEQRRKMSKSYQSLYPQIIFFLSTRSNNITEKALEIKTKIEIPLESFLASHIHMMINRQYTSKQRMYELIIYDHLFRFYKSKKHQKQDIMLS